MALSKAMNRKVSFVDEHNPLGSVCFGILRQLPGQNINIEILANSPLDLIRRLYLDEVKEMISI